MRRGSSVVVVALVLLCFLDLVTGGLLTGDRILPSRRRNQVF